MTSDAKTRLRRFVRCRVFWTIIISTLTYAILAVSLPTQPFLELVRILMAVTAIVVAIAFSADAFEAMTAEERDRTDSLVIGIFFQHVSLAVTGIWLLLYRLATVNGVPPMWMLNVLTFGFLSGWLSSIASILHVWAPGVLRRTDDVSDVPPARLRAVGLAVAIGVFSTLVVLATQPNAQWLVESIRPWLK